MKFQDLVLKLIAIFLFVIPISASAQDYHPIANRTAVIHPENDVRFTVLSPVMIRLEWDSLGHFTDQASFVVVNRNLPVASFSQKIQRGWLIIRTDSLLLRYKIGSGKFTERNLEITYYNKSEKPISWRPGMKQKDNLMGTYRTLDGYNGDMRDGKKIPLEKGILARDGWTLIDDSHSLLFDNAVFQWVDTTARHSAQDWYVLMYGSHYKMALRDYAMIGGKVPLPPRYAFGYWWSRYWRYTDNEFRNLIAKFKQFDVPLDVLVIDMDWHKQGWTGWTWDSSLFPHPGKFLAWTNKEHLKTTLNLHPADGVGPQERQYASFAKAMNFDTTGHKTIPYVVSDKKYVKTWFDTILNPYEKQGVDFWWLDWQQWPNDKKIKSLSNTWWLNYVFFTEKIKYGNTRPLFYHRWGGLGNHRYQVGFSGDADISWKSLEYQPYFTNTASNVLYDYWSHDIGGHNPLSRTQTIDPEMFARWVQYGVLSPIFRTHSTKNGLLNKEVWNFRGVYFDAIYNAIKFRYQIAPYIYTMARKTYDSALALCRPLYYNYPETENAYKYTREYQFGDDMLVAPIGAPADSNGISTKQVWLPQGNDWYEWNTGTLLKGGQIVNRQFSIDEYPLYVKAGAIIPMNADTIHNLQCQPALIHLGIFPGGTGAGNLYEDNGDNKDYADHYSETNYQTVENKEGLTLKINPVKGHFTGMRTARAYKVSFYGRAMPKSITIADKEIPYEPDGKSAHWYYNGDKMSIEVYIPNVQTSKGSGCVIHYDKGNNADINGLPEKMKRLYNMSEKLKYQDAYIVFPYRVAEMEELNRSLEYYPNKFEELVNKFNEDFPKIPEMMHDMKDVRKESITVFIKGLGLEND
ncbi:MAG TPA: TIM-barrel domain-containing protein [Arachidicoccus soli]|nr:TIM-barrel domain-containing protein [Arachidicoccus soli]